MGLHVTLQEIFTARLSQFLKTHRLPLFGHKAAKAILHCRTAVLGGHVMACPKGHVEKVFYNSCGHRACPKCAYLKIQQWLEKKSDLLLGCDHFHLTFSLPSELYYLWRYNYEILADLFFRSVKETLFQLLADPKHLGALPGLYMNLHTWNRALMLCPHLHVLCTGGGLALDGTWKTPRRVPYHRAPIVVDPSGLRAFVPDHVPGVPQPIPPTRSLPNDPETIGAFIGVGGSMMLQCLGDGTAKVTIKGNGYPPNSVLTVWVVWQNPPASGLPPILPQPLGGAPNSVVADQNGKFKFDRTLNFCPMEPQNGSIPLAIDIAKHIDGGNTYGATPEVPLAEISFIDPDTGEIFTSQGVGAGMAAVDQGVIPLLLQP